MVSLISFNLLFSNLFDLDSDQEVVAGIHSLEPGIMCIIHEPGILHEPGITPPSGKPGIARPQCKSITPAQSKAVTPLQIEAVTPPQIKAVTPPQIKAVTPPQIKAGTPSRSKHGKLNLL